MIAFEKAPIFKGAPIEAAIDAAKPIPLVNIQSVIRCQLSSSIFACTANMSDIPQFDADQCRCPRKSANLRTSGRHLSMTSEPIPAVPKNRSVWIILGVIGFVVLILLFAPILPQGNAPSPVSLSKKCTTWVQSTGRCLISEITVVNKTNDLTITDVTANRGACKQSMFVQQPKFPLTLNFGRSVGISFQCDPLVQYDSNANPHTDLTEVQVTTDQGSYTFTFQD